MGYTPSDNIFERRTENNKIKISFCDTILFLSVICLFFGICFTCYRFTNLYDYDKATVTKINKETSVGRGWDGKRHLDRDIDIVYEYEGDTSSYHAFVILDYIDFLFDEPSFVYVDPSDQYHPITPYRMWALPCVLVIGGGAVTIITAVKRHKLKRSLYTY